MAGTGPAPKPDDQRRRANAPAHGAERGLVNDEVLRGPALAGLLPTLPEEGPVADAVARWWETWRRSPMAQTFLGTDWQRLAMLAPLVAAYWSEPNTKDLAEIRLNEERLGATMGDRLKVRVRIEERGLAAVTPIASAKDRFKGRGRDV